jgi:hypothetical protein
MSKDKERGSSKRPDPIDHARLLGMLADKFPEVPQAFDKYGILHPARTGSFSKVWKLSVNNVSISSLYWVLKLARQPSMAPVNAA